MSEGLTGVLVKVLPTSAAAARDQVDALLRAQFLSGNEGIRDDIVWADALLVTSELVTNACRHGGGITGFSAKIHGDELFLTVADASTEFPVARPRPPGQFTVGGYGWPMVSRLATSLTVVPTATGKRIEAVIPLM